MKASPKKNNIALIGARGAGKSRLSRKLGKSSGRTVFSTDTLISYEANGMSIPELVKREGWAGFREREFNILKTLSKMEGIILDCGGGILIEVPDDTSSGLERFSERKAALLHSCASVIYIKRNTDWLLKKVSGDPNRPDLTGPYLELLERRLPYYEKAADCIIDLDILSTEDAINKIAEIYAL